MTTSPYDKPVPYCACTLRQANIKSTSTNTTCAWCHQVVPDDNAIYMVLKDHVEYLQHLGGKRKGKSKKMNKKKSRRDMEDAMESLIYSEDKSEDIRELFDKYSSDVLCASARVLVNSDSLKARSLLFSSFEYLPPAPEPKEVAEEETVWDAIPGPAAERAPPYDYPCEPDVVAPLELYG
ncbi:uncharacterized protein FTOL_12962 [Fusarium torulosum]|uniref:Uncharacterized protein n=1 Tax=Fusarium torulosum TaxID=33205 RepID=A0AAE8SPE0_9HYPO|nr:uncharacterized protein FTOL_12962 [Fusarium torulosum]